MNKKQCLFCYKEISDSQSDYHKQCSKKIFGSTIPPVLEYSNSQMLELAEKVIQSQSTITGVQPKLSLGLSKMPDKDKPRKLTIVGVFGKYILKPPSQYYLCLPELEDLTMHLAELSGIETVPHTLIRLSSGELSYLTKRIDRDGNRKIHMEDMCQLTERLTEAKYRGSYEQIGKAIIQHSTNPGFDIINFFEQVVFSYLTGNSDMHLKNFSLISDPIIGYKLSPAYDMVASSLVLEGDDEELALSLNGKKKRLKRKDFEESYGRFNIDNKVIDNLFERFKLAIPQWHEFIELSFLPEQMKKQYHEMIDQKGRNIDLI